MSSSSSNSSDFSKSIILKTLNDYKRKQNLLHDIQEKLNESEAIMKLINFEFFPRRLKISKGTTVIFEVCKNENEYSNLIYTDEERSFFLYIVELDIQSPELFKGFSFII